LLKVFNLVAVVQEQAIEAEALIVGSQQTKSSPHVGLCQPNKAWAADPGFSLCPDPHDGFRHPLTFEMSTANLGNSLKGPHCSLVPCTFSIASQLANQE